MRELLLTPGPVMVPDAILDACALPLLHHRSVEFKDLSADVWQRLQSLLYTRHPVLLLSGSAMSGMEAAMASTLAPDARVLVLSHGRFGGRLAEMASILQARVDVLEVPWGASITSSAVDEHLEKATEEYAAVWMVHGETSTGVALDIASIASCIRRHQPDTLICVDAVLSVGIHPLYVDAWDLDITVFGIQKGLMCPPGIAGVVMSTRAQERMHAVPRRSYILDLGVVLHNYHRGLFTWTPPVTLMRGLHTALRMIDAETLPAMWQRQQRNTEHLHAGLRARGFALFGEATSYGVTVVHDAHSAHTRHHLLHDYGIRIANGQERLDGTVVRIATCGAATIEHMNTLLTALDGIVHP